MKRRKVAINLMNFSDNKIDGVGYYVKRLLSETLKDHRYTEKFDTYIFYPRTFDCQKIFAIDEQAAHLVPLTTPSNRLGLLAFKFMVFPFILKKIGIDIIFNPAPPTSPLLYFFFKTVSTIHDLTPLFINRGQGHFYKYYYRMIAWLTAQFSHKIIAVSLNTKSDIVKYLSVDSTKINLLYPIAGKNIAKKTDWQNFFILVSTIQPGKNIENAIRAFAKFLENTGDLFQDFKIYIIGRDGWGYNELKCLPQKLGIEKNVIFTGYVDENMLDWYFENCCAVIYVSFYEGFGIPILEALHYGAPSVASNVSSIPEVVGNTGILVDPNNVADIAQGMVNITKIDRNDEFMIRIQNQASKFEPNAQVQKFLALLLSI